MLTTTLLKIAEETKSIKPTFKPPLTFRDLPPSLSFSQLQPDFSLISSHAFAETKRLTDASKEEGRFYKDELKSTHDQIVLNEHHYIIQGIAGSGNFGKVEYIQDMDDPRKPFYVLKTQDDTDISRNEYEKLKTLDLVVDDFTQEVIPQPSERRRRTNTQHCILMKMAPGIPLSKYLRNLSSHTQPTMPQWIKIVISMMQQVKQIHDRNILHLDIKLPNFLLDLPADSVSLVDFGFALNARWAYSELEQGTPFYLAPEIRKPEIKNKRLYSQKSDIYALGIAIAEMLNLLNCTYPFRVIIEESLIHLKGSSKIPDKMIRLTLLDILQRMTQNDYRSRPSLEDCILPLENILSNLTETIGLIEVSEFINDGGLSFIPALQHMDKVFLIDTKGCEEEQHLLAKHILEKHNVRLAKKIFFEPEQDIAELFPQITDHLKQNNLTVQQYFYFSQDKTSAVLNYKTHGVHPILIEDMKNYRREIQTLRLSQTLAPRHQQFLKDKLTSELKRFDQAHTTPSPIVSARKRTLTRAITFFDKATYREACVELEKLTSCIKHTNCIKAFFTEKNIYRFTIKGADEISKIKTEFSGFGPA